jgi:uncharacterized protein with HEPN domain
MARIATSALLGIIEHAGLAVATLVEGLEREELLRSRLTRAEVLRQLQLITDSDGRLDAGVRRALPELDWSGWAALRAQLSGPAGASLDEALWFACTSLVPATLLWLRVYRQDQAALFRMTP